MHTAEDLSWCTKRKEYIVDTLKDVLWELDARLVFTYVSPSDQEQRGYARAEVVGQPFFAFLGEASRQDVVASMARYANPDRIGDQDPLVLCDVQQVCRDGRTIWTEVTAKAVVENGALAGFVGCTREISSAKKLKDNALKESAARVEQLNRELERISIMDKLTGAYNRARFEPAWKQEVARAKRYKLTLSLAIVNLDDFRRINETHGIVKGDTVLVEVVSVINRFTRDSDSVFRWGNDEFIVLLPHTAKEQAIKQAERLRLAVEQNAFSIGDRVTASVGVTEYIEGEDLESIVKRADVALYIAKRGGHNQVASR